MIYIVTQTLWKKNFQILYVEPGPAWGSESEFTYMFQILYVEPGPAWGSESEFTYM